MLYLKKKKKQRKSQLKRNTGAFPRASRAHEFFYTK